MITDIMFSLLLIKWIGREYYNIKDVVKLHNWMNYELNKNGAYIDSFIQHTIKAQKIYKKEKELRKPNTGMIKLAVSKWDILTKKSIVIGDKKLI